MRLVAIFFSPLIVLGCIGPALGQFYPDAGAGPSPQTAVLSQTSASSDMTLARLPSVTDGTIYAACSPVPGNQACDSPGLTCDDLVPGMEPPLARAMSSRIGGRGGVCDECPNRGLVFLLGYDAFRGISDDSWENNGIHIGFNFATRLGRFSDWTGIGFQLGGSLGIFDWSGTDYRPIRNDVAQTQTFLTYGFFRKASDTSHWTAGLVQDWMFNNNFGVFSQNPTLSQWRGQIGYVTNPWNEFGVWGTWHGTSANHDVPGVGPTTWRALNLVAAFWHHKWTLGGGDTWLVIGAPDTNRLTGDHSLGSYLASAIASVPLSDRLALYTNVTYLRPSARPSPDGSEQDAWNFTIGLALYPGGNARSLTVAGRRWMPMMPVANNGSFMVDTNNH